MTPARLFMFVWHLAVAAGAIWLAMLVVDWLAG